MRISLTPILNHLKPIPLLEVMMREIVFHWHNLLQLCIVRGIRGLFWSHKHKSNIQLEFTQEEVLLTSVWGKSMFVTHWYPFFDIFAFFLYSYQEWNANQYCCLWWKKMYTLSIYTYSGIVTWPFITAYATIR